MPERTGWRDPLHPVPRARSQFEKGDESVPDVFVGLALSGGGSRAANFSLAAMEQLNELGLLKHVTAISSTSGGALAGAYYALKGPDLDWADGRQRMGTNFLGRWIAKNLYPHKFLQTVFTHADRSDLMAEVFDEVLFDSKTYVELGDLKVGRPLFIANATHASSGRRFPFTEEYFSSHQRSRLDTYPISHAVMASAAFPGVFNSVTLSRYPSLNHPTGTTQIPIGYDHFLDGGAVDNLGLDHLIKLAVSHYNLKTQASNNAAKKSNTCFLFVVDAYPSGVAGRKAWQPDPRGLIDFIVDLNFMDAFDALLTRRRDDLLASVGLGQSTTGGGNFIGNYFQTVRAPGLSMDSILPIDKLVEIDIPERLSENQNPAALVHQVPKQSPTYPDKGYFRCTIWHLDLSGLLSIKPYVGEPGKEPQRLKMDTDFDHPLIHHRVRLNRIVSQIDTDFRLAGPKHCSAHKLQDALYAVAFVAVREDHFNRTRVCNWFREAGLDVAENCEAFPGNRTLQDLDLNIKATGPSIAGRPGDQEIECEEDSK